MAKLDKTKLERQACCDSCGVKNYWTRRRVSRHCIESRLRRLSAVRETPCLLHRARITAFSWSPRHQDYFAFGNKIGRIFLKNVGDVNATEGCSCVEGRLSSGGVAGISFDPTVDTAVSILSTIGNVTWWDYVRGTTERLFASDREVDEFGCIAVSQYHSGLIAVGSSNGELTLIDRKSGGRPIMKRKIHNGVVKSIEFSNHPAGLLATASTDKTAQVWDVRMLVQDSSSTKPLNVFNHRKPVVSARFSKTNSSCLMTTDRDSGVRTFYLPTSKPMTSITPFDESLHFIGLPGIATWHPLTDFIVTGRYASHHSQIIWLKLWDPNPKPGTTPGILIECHWCTVEGTSSPRIQVNEFSHDGETLAAVTENAIIIFRYDYHDE